jgi:hypothetical protein
VARRPVSGRCRMSVPEVAFTHCWRVPYVFPFMHHEWGIMGVFFPALTPAYSEAHAACCRSVRGLRRAWGQPGWGVPTTAENKTSKRRRSCRQWPQEWMYGLYQGSSQCSAAPAVSSCHPDHQTQNLTASAFRSGCTGAPGLSPQHTEVRQCLCRPLW